VKSSNPTSAITFLFLILKQEVLGRTNRVLSFHCNFSICHDK
jgi:hypothetical protein